MPPNRMRFVVTVVFPVGVMLGLIWLYHTYVMPHIADWL